MFWIGLTKHINGLVQGSSISIANTLEVLQSCTDTYRKISNTRRTKSQILNVSRLVLQLSLPNPLKPSVNSRMKM